MLGNNKKFVESVLKIASDLILKFERDASSIKADELCTDFNDCMESIKEKYDSLNERFSSDKVFYANKDKYITDCKDLLKEIFESQAYKTLTSLHFKLQISNQANVQRDGASENLARSEQPKVSPSTNKREKKEETKGSSSVEDEMINNFPDTIAYKEHSNNNNGTIPQELIQYQLRFDEFEERFRVLTANLEEKSEQNKQMQDRIDDLENKNEKCLEVISTMK